MILQNGNYIVGRLKDTTNPIINEISTSRTSGNITVNVDATDEGSGITKYEYYYKDMSSSGDYQKIESTENIGIINNLQPLTAYNVYVMVYDAEGNYATSETLTVTTNQKTVAGIEIKVPTKVEYEYGEELNLTNGTVCIVYDDGTKGSEATLTESMISGYNATNPGEQTIIVTYEGQTTTYKVTVKEVEKPTITKQPEEKTIKQGESITFMIEASVEGNNSDLTYQWYKSDSAEEIGVAITNATTKEYLIENVNLEDAGYYYCIVTNHGVSSATSSRAKLTVEPRIISVESVSLNANILNLIKGNNATLIEAILPNNASNKNVTWTSSDNTVATVENGVVTAVSAGTVTITVTTEDGNKTASCTVTVEEVIEPEDIKVEGVTLNKQTATITVGEASLVLKETVQPSDASNKNVTWTSSDNTVATVENGVVTAISAGTATITVITEDGNKTASCTVTVEEPAIEPEDVKVTGVTLDKKTATITVGEANLVLKETVQPSDATNKNITWISSDNTIATVENGVVTAKSAGTVTITVTTEDGNKTASCIVTVEEAQGTRVTGVTLDKQTASMKINDILELIATILPEGANTELQWSSDDKKVATVDSTGKVTAVSAGTATITVTTTDGGYTAQCVVTVEKDQTSDNGNNNGSSNSSGLSSTDSTQAPTRIPQTGISYVVIGAMIIIIANGIVAYIRYKKLY